jgi:hypothetical protein
MITPDPEPLPPILTSVWLPVTAALLALLLALRVFIQFQGG